jgi:hypothetical protein
MSVTRFVPALLKSHEVLERFTLAIYRPAPVLAERLDAAKDPAADIRARADKLNVEYGIGFWDAVLAIAMKDGDIPDHYVNLAILHDRAPDEQEISFEKQNVSVEWLEGFIARSEPEHAVALSSRVQLTGGYTAHIPMMDFRCTHSDRNLAVVKRALAAMGQTSGAIARSPRSYHFYGSELLSDAEWTRFLALALLFSPIVDVRYVAHRLADGACRLRISQSAKKGAAPVIMELLS